MAGEPVEQLPGSKGSPQVSDRRWKSEGFLLAHYAVGRHHGNADSPRDQPYFVCPYFIPARK